MTTAGTAFRFGVGGALDARASTWKAVSATVRNARTANQRFQVASPRSVALLFTCLAQGTLVNPIGGYSIEMLDLLDKDSPPGTGTGSFFDFALSGMSPAAHVYSKIGMDASVTNCDVVFVKRPRPAPKSPLRYVAAVLGDAPMRTILDLALALDGCIDQAHP